MIQVREPVLGQCTPFQGLLALLSIWSTSPHLKSKSGGAGLAQSGEHVTLDLLVTSSSSGWAESLL